MTAPETPRRNRPLPELLAPAGSPEALEAALLAGADAVYLGGSRFNARMNAHNFDRAALEEAVTHAHRLGGRVYLTLNTLVWDRELPDARDAAYEAAVAGVDALIIADMGAAALIRRALPNLPLHASTQLSGHNASIGQVLADFGFSRFVIARETALPDLAAAVANNPLEVEVFIHGALCVSHSGQCLFSSLVGGRSGNRGECAQPCRLPYGNPSACADCPGGNRTGMTVRNSRRDVPAKGKGAVHHGTSPASSRPDRENYPLSLKDLSLAAHVPALIEAGVASLKIEGRMKSPGYVGGVTAIWRKLLHEGRAATDEEIEALGDLFSRGGFTDGYQVGRIDRRMMGVRSEADKDRTAAAEKAAVTAKYPPCLPLSLTFTAREGAPVTLTARAPLYRQGGLDPHMGVTASAPAADGAVSVTVEGDIPAPAETASAALTPASVEKQLSRTGGTPYRADRVTADIPPSGGWMLPLSRLNALRREALERLDAARMAALPAPAAGYRQVSPREITEELLTRVSVCPTASQSGRAQDDAEAAVPVRRTARFRSVSQITPAAVDYFDILYLPLGVAAPASVPPNKRGVILPPVIFDREAPAVAEALTATLNSGVRHLLVGNIGHLPLVRAVSDPDAVCIHGDLRLNIANTPAAARMGELGFCDLILSPELTLPRMRDIAAALSEGGLPPAAGAMVYGRIPLMLLEKCAIREIYRDTPSAEVCTRICGEDRAVMRDRLGKDFPVLREDAPAGDGHRNVVYNSLPLGMSDRVDDLYRLRFGHHHYLFSVEPPREVDAVIAAYRDRKPLPGEVRRMMK